MDKSLDNNKSMAFTCKHRDTEVIASGLAEKKLYSRPTCTGAIVVEA